MSSLALENAFLYELRRTAGDTPLMRLNPMQWGGPVKRLGLSDAQLREVWLRLLEHKLVVQMPASQSFALTPNGVDLADGLIAQVSEEEKPKSRIGF